MEMPSPESGGLFYLSIKGYTSTSGGLVETLKEWLKYLYDAQKLKELIIYGSYPALMAIVFSETGLLIGFFLPGDSLLVTAGILAAGGLLSPGWLIVLLSIAAIVGDSVGYSIGFRTGPLIFKRPKSLLFDPENLNRAHRFYEKYGGKTIVLARFLPIFRTFAPVVAGVGKMKYGRFLFYNIFGGIGWVVSMIAAGYFLGSIPGIDKHLHIVIILVIAISFIPGIVEFLKERKKKKKGVNYEENC
jgi:membrane-associated protein